MLTATDLSVFQDFKLGGRFDIQVGVTILNLFDQDTVTRRYNSRMVGDLPLNSEEFSTSPGIMRHCCGRIHAAGRQVQPAGPVPGAAGHPLTAKFTF